MGKVVSIGKASEATKQPSKNLTKRQREKSHTDRKALFCDVVVRLGEYNLAEVSRKSGVSYTTLHNWVFGETVSPILRTIIDVCEVIDLNVVLVDTYTVQKSNTAVENKSRRRSSAG